MIIGYARTSTVEQVAGLESQLADLKNAGCEKIYQEHCSSLCQRKQLRIAMDFCREGDVFVITKIDRLARSVRDLMEVITELEDKKVPIRILNFGMDTNTPTGKLMLIILAGVAQFEREIMLERQREGIAKAKKEGKYKGRKPLPKYMSENVMECINLGMSKQEIVKKLDISIASVYRIVRRHLCNR